MNLNEFTQEELKVALGQLLLDLRGNWAYDYYERLEEASALCSLIDDDTSDVENSVTHEQSGEGYVDGRIFRGDSFYGYISEEGTTDRVKTYLESNLTHPEYCEVLTKIKN